ncbi:MAG TPA: hypothetical protein QGH16_11100, partial [Verrucomicrobiota bacterium]|nr:hypothetical protein [Verrucomicrobiota bacterium]
NENINFIPMIANVYLRMNQAEQGIQIINQHIEDFTQNTRAMVITARCQAVMGKKNLAYEILNALLHRKITKVKYISEHFIADLYAELGDKEKAFYWMNQAIDNNAPHCSLFNQKPMYDQWKNDPEYQALLKKVNLDKS